MRAVGGDGRRARALISPNIPCAARKRGFAAFGVPGIKDESLEFDWAMVEQIRPQIDQPDPAWPSIFAGIAIPPWPSEAGRKASSPPNTLNNSAASCLTAVWNPWTPDIWCMPPTRKGSYGSSACISTTFNAARDPQRECTGFCRRTPWLLLFLFAAGFSSRGQHRGAGRYFHADLMLGAAGIIQVVLQGSR